MNVLSGIPLSSNDLGVVAWYTESFAGANWTVYLPVTVQQESAADSRGRFRLVFIPPSELSKSTVTAMKVSADGKVLATPLNGKQVEGGYFPAERPIPVDLALPNPSDSLYRVLIGADMKGGGSASADFLVYLGGSSQVLPKIRDARKAKDDR
jgi:hypothetical protein